MFNDYIPSDVAHSSAAMLNFLLDGGQISLQHIMQVSLLLHMFDTVGLAPTRKDIR